MGGGTKVAIKNLPDDCTEEDVEDLFKKYGKLEDYYVKSGRDRDSCEAYVTFAYPEDADRAVADRDGYDYDSRKLKVQVLAADKGKGRSRADSRGRGGDRGRGGGREAARRDSSRGRGGARGGRRDDSRDRRPRSRDRYGKGGKYGDRDDWYARRGKGKGKGPFDDWGGRDDYYDRKGKGKKGKYDDWGKGGKKGEKKGKGKKGSGMSNEYFRVVVKPLPAGSSWQDLKDFLRGCRSATPRYTDVNNDTNVGLGGYDTQDEVNKVLAELDGKEFKNRDGATTTVEITIELADENEKPTAEEGGADAHAAGDSEDMKADSGADAGVADVEGAGGDADIIAEGEHEAADADMVKEGEVVEGGDADAEMKDE